MKSNYGYLPDEKKPVVMDIMRRLAKPPTDFYKRYHGGRFTSQDNLGTTEEFDVKTPLPNVWYKRSALGGREPRTDHVIGNFRHQYWTLIVYGDLTERLFECWDVFEDGERIRLDDFSMTVETEWRKIQSARQDPQLTIR